MKAYQMAMGLALSYMLFAGVASAQHAPKGGQRGGRQTHSAPAQRGGERGIEHGHGRNEGHVINNEYRGRYFGRDHREFAGAFYGRPTFLFGGIWFGIDVWPSYWLASDYVYVDYVDGDYFIVNERYPEARVAIVIE